MPISQCLWQKNTENIYVLNVKRIPKVDLDDSSYSPTTYPNIHVRNLSKGYHVTPSDDGLG